MKITVVGGGNVGTQIAVHCSEKKHEVIIYSSRPEKFSQTIKIVNEKNEVIHTSSYIKATNDDNEAFLHANLIFITLPAFCLKDFSEKIYPYVCKGLMVCLVPGTGGGECFFKKHLNKGLILFGLQRVPSVARLVEYGKIVKAVGYRKELFVSAIPTVKTQMCTSLIQSIFEIKTNPLPNYLNITLTPSNPILHTTRLSVIFREYKPGYIYNHLPLFYEEWDDESSKLLFKCDQEVQEICKALNNFDLSYVKSLKEHYESATPELLTKKIRNIDGFKGLTTPSIQTKKGIIPDLESRYFTADFSYGLIILIEIAKMYNVETPYLDKVMNWYLGISEGKDCFSFKKVNINTKEDFEKFYQK